MDNDNNHSPEKRNKRVIFISLGVFAASFVISPLISMIHFRTTMSGNPGEESRMALVSIFSIVQLVTSHIMLASIVVTIVFTIRLMIASSRLKDESELDKKSLIKGIGTSIFLSVVCSLIATFLIYQLYRFNHFYRGAYGFAIVIFSIMTVCWAVAAIVFGRQSNSSKYRDGKRDALPDDNRKARFNLGGGVLFIFLCLAATVVVGMLAVSMNNFVMRSAEQDSDKKFFDFTEKTAKKLNPGDSFEFTVKDGVLEYKEEEVRLKGGRYDYLDATIVCTVSDDNKLVYTSDDDYFWHKSKEFKYYSF